MKFKSVIFVQLTIIVFYCNKILGNPHICPLGEDWNKCANPCQSTCQRPLPQGCDDLECTGACVCPEGFVRQSRNGRCIPAKSCTESCRTNEYHDQCALACPRTCEDPSPGCIKICVQACVCQANYVMNASDICIPQDRCPAENRHY